MESNLDLGLVPRPDAGEASQLARRAGHRARLHVDLELAPKVEVAGSSPVCRLPYICSTLRSSHALFPGSGVHRAGCDQENRHAEDRLPLGASTYYLPRP